MAALTRGGTSQAEPIVMTTFYVPLVCSRSQWILHVINPELGAAAFAELVPPNFCLLSSAEKTVWHHESWLRFFKKDLHGQRSSVHPKMNFHLTSIPSLCRNWTEMQRLKRLICNFPISAVWSWKAVRLGHWRWKSIAKSLFFFHEPATHCEGYNKRQTKKAKGRKGRQVYTVFILIYTLGSGEKEDGLSPRMMLWSPMITRPGNQTHTRCCLSLFSVLHLYSLFLQGVLESRSFTSWY